MYTIDYNSYRSIKGFNRRPRFLVLHYTAVNFTGSIAALTGPSVSSHYLVPDPTDPTYAAAGFSDLRIFNLVDESERAWHAGISAWAKRYNLNDTSIGVEIVYVATEEKGAFTFPPYNPAQIQAVKALAANIIQRYPDITPTHVVGHSDIAIGRKSDPGAAFPWKELYDAGIGAWYEEAPNGATRNSSAASSRTKPTSSPGWACTAMTRSLPTPRRAIKICFGHFNCISGRKNTMGCRMLKRLPFCMRWWTGIFRARLFSQGAAGVS